MSTSQQGQSSKVRMNKWRDNTSHGLPNKILSRGGGRPRMRPCKQHQRPFGRQRQREGVFRHPSRHDSHRRKKTRLGRLREPPPSLPFFSRSGHHPGGASPCCPPALPAARTAVAIIVRPALGERLCVSLCAGSGEFDDTHPKKVAEINVREKRRAVRHFGVNPTLSLPPPTSTDRICFSLSLFLISASMTQTA